MATPFSAFGVFDGHGGKSAATFASKELLPTVTKLLDRCKTAGTVLPAGTSPFTKQYQQPWWHRTPASRLVCLLQLLWLTDEWSPTVVRTHLGLCWRRQLPTELLSPT